MRRSLEDRHPQFRILEAVGLDSLFVGVLHKRYGTKIQEFRGISGTEAEFKYAIKYRSRIKILTYFRRPKKRPSNGEPRRQYDTLDRLKKRLKRTL